MPRCGAAHGRLRLAWDDPDDPAISGYRVPRRLPAQDPPGEFAVLVERTGFGRQLSHLGRACNQFWYG